MAVGALISLCCGSTAVFVWLALDLLGIRRLSPGRRWQGYGLMLLTTGSLIECLAAVLGSSLSQRRIIDIATLLLILTGLPVLVRGLVYQAQGPDEP
jgi:hypothetical protein